VAHAIEDTKIGFIGLGVMGKSMAGHLLTAGYELRVFNRTKTAADDLVRQGAIWENRVADLAAKCSVIITIVGFPPDVEQVYFGGDGILENCAAGSFVIDMTTSRPDLAVKIYETAKSRGISAIDAPVSGGDVGAKEARLSIMAGGDKEAFDEVLPLFQIMGKTIVHQGAAGAGQHCKACNQVAIASGMLGVCEAIAYAKKSGLDPTTVLESITGGAAGSWSLANYGPRMIAGNFDPGFFVKHFIKDMEIAAGSSDSMNLDTPGLDTALSLYKKLAAEGGADLGTQSLFTLYDKE
jgi:3-hydroxyisobutyrate dehydrogenase